MYVRICKFIAAYQGMHAGEMPPIIELSEFEARQLVDEMAPLLPSGKAGKMPSRFAGVRIRIIQDA